MTPGRRWLWAAGVILLLAAGLTGLAVWTGPERDAVRVYNALTAAANRGAVEAARQLCSERYLAGHRLHPASEGGIVGLPRNIHKNFQAWRQGPNVWLCPTNRVGPVYQFVRGPLGSKFDGPVGLLQGRGDFVPMDDLTEDDRAADAGRSN